MLHQLAARSLSPWFVWVRYLGLVCATMMGVAMWDVAFASHYTGTYSDSGGSEIILQHDAQGILVGQWVTPQGILTIEGHATDSGPGQARAYSNSQNLTFSVQLSPDGNTLMLDAAAAGRQVFTRRSYDATFRSAGFTPLQEPTALSVPYVGTYSDGQLEVTLEGGPVQYHGQISLNNQVFPLQAQANAQQLVGFFQAGDNRFEFNAALQGETLVFVTGSARYNLVSWAGGEQRTPTAAGWQQTVRLREFKVVDEHGFERPMTAMTMLLPDNWQTQSGVLWFPSLSCVAAPQAYFFANSPDELTGLATLLAESWSFNNLGFQEPVSEGCLTDRIGSVRDYLMAVVQRNNPNARVLGQLERPDIMAALSVFQHYDPMTHMRIWPEAGEITFVHEHQGTAVQVKIIAVVLFMEQNLPGIYPGEFFHHVQGFSFGFALSAPEAEFTEFEAFAMTLLNLVNVDPEWQRAIDNFHRENNRVAREEADKRIAINAQSNEYISALISSSYAARTESNDRTSTMFSEAIRDVERYDDPVTGRQVELPAYYDNTWRLNDGTYVLTDDVFFDPYSTWGVDGQRLERAP